MLNITSNALRQQVMNNEGELDRPRWLSHSTNIVGTIEYKIIFRPWTRLNGLDMLVQVTHTCKSERQMTRVE